MIEELGIPSDVIDRVVAESILSGIPYIYLCLTCRVDYRVCIVLRVLPIDIDKYSVDVMGMVVTVDKDKELDQFIEEVFRRTTTIKYYQGRVSFYIPYNLTKPLYKYICSNVDWSSVEYSVMGVEDQLIFLEEEKD